MVRLSTLFYPTNASIAEVRIKESSISERAEKRRKSFYWTSSITDCERRRPKNEKHHQKITNQFISTLPNIRPSMSVSCMYCHSCNCWLCRYRLKTISVALMCRSYRFLRLSRRCLSSSPVLYVPRKATDNYLWYMSAMPMYSPPFL